MADMVIRLNAAIPLPTVFMVLLSVLGSSAQRSSEVRVKAWSWNAAVLGGMPLVLYLVRWVTGSCTAIIYVRRGQREMVRTQRDHVLPRSLNVMPR